MQYRKFTPPPRPSQPRIEPRPIVPKQPTVAKPIAHIPRLDTIPTAPHNVPSQKPPDESTQPLRTIPPTPTVETPLINVNDRDSRLDRAKEVAGTIGHIAVVKIVPRCKALLRSLTTKARSRLKKSPGATSAQTKYIAPTLKKVPKSLTKKRLLVGGIIIALIAWFVGIRLHNPEQTSMPFVAGSQTQANTADTGGSTPEFHTLTPSGKSIVDLGGWARVSPADRNPVFAYKDTLNNIPISVSQQPLPKEFVTDHSKLTDMANNFNAKDKKTANDGTVYFVGTSKDGPQSIITTKHNVLVLIKAEAVIKDETMSTYIAGLN